MSRTEIGSNDHIQNDDEMIPHPRYGVITFVAVLLWVAVIMLMTMGAGCPDAALYRTADTFRTADTTTREKMSRHRQPPPNCDRVCASEGADMGYRGLSCQSYRANGDCNCGGGNSVRGTFPVQCKAMVDDGNPW